MNTVFTIAPGPQDGNVFSENHLESFRTLNVENMVIFSTNSLDSSEKMVEEASHNGINCNVKKLTPLSTDGIEDSDQLSGIPWNIANEMISAYSDLESTITMHGRGSSLHSHLLWVVSNSFGSNSVNWDGGYSPTYVHNESQLNSEVSPKLMSAILELTAKRTTNFFDSASIASEDGVTEISGVQAASLPCIKSGFIEKLKTNSSRKNVTGRVDTTLYKLTAEGFPVALKYWSEQRLDIQFPKFKQLLISFGRLVEGGSKNFLNIISKIEAHDSHLIILQRYSNTLESGVYSFDDLIGNPDFSEIQSELEEYGDRLARKIDEEDFRIISPIVVINPSSESDFALEFQSRMFAEIRKFEFENDIHNWNFDITGCVSKLLPKLSEFITASRSNLYYVLKSKKGVGVTGTTVENSPFTKADHVLALPSYLALESLKKVNESKLMTLLVMLYFEEGAFSKPKSPLNLKEFINRDRSVSKNNGLTFKDLSRFVEPLTEMVGQQISIEKNHTRLAGDLISNKFIIRANDVGTSRYILTELGKFVAIWVRKHLGWK